MHKDNILEVKHLHKRFSSKGITVKAVTDVSFDVKPGDHRHRRRVRLRQDHLGTLHRSCL